MDGTPEQANKIAPTEHQLHEGKSKAGQNDYVAILSQATGKDNTKMKGNTTGMIIVTLLLVAYVLLSLWSARRRREMEALASMDNGLSEASFREIMHTMMLQTDDETTDIAGRATE